ncbi:MAG: GH36-type glycosyl hydrolase domain-containing protein, partial [Planctomycetota bacterium]
MKFTRILMIALILAALSFTLAVSEHNESKTPSQKELARKILANPDLPFVLEEARKLLGTGLRAGSGYGEVWIRDLNTFITPALDIQKHEDIRRALLIFFHFQGADGNIVDGYIPKDKANVSYKYIKSPSMPQYLAHKNTVETDQEASIIQAVRKYVKKTGDDSVLKEAMNGAAVLKRMENALDFLFEHRYNAEYGLIWGATTSDWGDVQPEHSWGVVLDESSHLAIDIYDNAMVKIAIDSFLELAGDDYPTRAKWKAAARKLSAKTMKHLWESKRQKFRPHIYLDKSPFPEDFDEGKIYYHGGTTIAMEADLLHKDQIKQVYRDMVANKKAAGAATIGLTVYPAYPEGFFKNKAMA